MKNDLFTSLNHLLKQKEGSDTLLSYFEQFSKALFNCKDFKSALNTFYNELRKVYREQHIEFILTQNPQRIAKFQYDESGKRMAPTGEFVQKNTLYHYLLTKRQAVLTNDYPNFCRDLGVLANGTPAHAWIGVPMLVRGKPLGAMIIWDERDGQFFRLHDKQFLTSMAGMMSFAAENIYLHDYILEKSDNYKIFEGLLPKGNARNSVKNVLTQLQHAVLQQKDVVYTAMFMGAKRAKKWRLLAEEYGKPAYNEAGIVLQTALESLEDDVFNETPPLFIPQHHVAHFLYDSFGKQLDQLSAKSLLLFPFVVNDAYLGAWVVLLKRATEPNRDELQMYQFIFYVMTQLIEKKALAEQNRKYQNYTKHLERMKVLGELASGTMHNLNNLLSVIIGKTQLLQKKLEGTSHQRDLELLLQTAKDGANSILRLQNYSIAKDAEDVAQTLNINTLVQEVVEIARPRFEEEAQSQGIHYHLKLDLGSIKPVKGDATTLREVMLNLINNALDAMPHGGKLNIQTTVKDGKVVIFVSDSGSGIPHEVQDKVFEPFFTTKGTRGNGLGLSIAWEIIQKHHGSIHVDSSPGKGAIFMIELPCAGDEILPQHDKPEFFQPLSYKILLVEDKGIVRETLAEMLEDEGCEVITAASAHEAVLKFQKHRCDVVFADLSMPNVNGVELAAKLKDINPAIPVFIVTGWNQIDNGFLKTNGHIDGIIKKPFNMDKIRQELLRTVGTLNGHYHANGFSV